MLDQIVQIQNEESTRIDVYKTVCPKRCWYIKVAKTDHWVGECIDVTDTKLICQNI